MIGQIRSPVDFSVVGTINISAYDIPLECADSASGTITLAGSLEGDYQYRLLTLEGFDGFWTITSMDTNDSENMTIQIKDGYSFFDQCCAQGIVTSSYGDTLTLALIKDMFMQNSFSSFTPLYSKFAPEKLQLVVEEDAETEVSALIDNMGLVTADYEYSHNSNFIVTNISKLVHDLIKGGLNVSLEFFYGAIDSPLSTDNVNLILSPQPLEPAVVYFNDGHAFLQNATVKGDICSGYYSVGTNERYYLSFDGQVTMSKSTQIPGYFIFEKISDNRTAYEHAIETFAANKTECKVTFMSDARYHLNQPLRLMLPRGETLAQITKVNVKSTDNRYAYECGDYPATATEKITANSWDYVQRLPIHPRKGELVFM